MGHTSHVEVVLYSSLEPEVMSVTHVGLLANTSRASLECAEQACAAGGFQIISFSMCKDGTGEPCQRSFKASHNWTKMCLKLNGLEAVIS